MTTRVNHGRLTKIIYLPHPQKHLLRGCQTNDKVGRLLWAWFSCPTKSADKIGELWHTADIFICYFVRYQPAQQPNADCKI